MPGTLNVGGHDIITHSGDAGAGDVTVNVQNRLVLNSSGNVGIGTSTINNRLVVESASAEQGITIRGGGYDALKIGMVNPGVSNDGIINVAIANALRFATNNTERMRIDPSGSVFVGKTSNNFGAAGFAFGANGGTIVSDDDTTLALNRLTSDGQLLGLYQGSVLEGNISVSGIDVTLNGATLSRWAQLPDGSRDGTIVKGTVMTNLDDLCEWAHPDEFWTEEDEIPVDEEGNPTAAVGDLKRAAFVEDNGQLNRMVVSSVEGDPNVAGVFVNWDNDDEQFNDMIIAMTGDMVIRIAQGTTVQRGDLLMSAGDGTAKPQGDDIVRSKTIAKVTSTHISHTYEDGSYLVPCVLMAC